MSRQVYEFDFKDRHFRFHNTADSKELIEHIFTDNYKVLASNIDFQPGDVILDVGANEGIFSIMMAKLYPHTRIIAIEPVSRTIAALMDNIALNDIANIYPAKIALGKERGFHTMNISKDHSGGSSGVIRFNPQDHIQEEVQIMTFDELLKSFEINKVKLMKMDIEGGEYEALYFSDMSKVEYFAGEIHSNAYLSYNNSHPHMLINWLSDRVKLLGVEICKMSD